MPSINAIPINVRSASFGAVGDGTTDDTAAIQAAIDAAYTAGAPLYFPAGQYLIGGAPTTRTGVNYDGTVPSVTAQLWLPEVDLFTAKGQTLRMYCDQKLFRSASVVGNVPGPEYTATATLKSTCTVPGAAVIGGIARNTAYPWTGLTLCMENLTIRLPDNPATIGLDASYIAGIDLKGVSVTPGGFSAGNMSEPTNTTNIGVACPINSNGAHTLIDDLFVIGQYMGVRAEEHMDMKRSQIWLCKAAMGIRPSYHDIRFDRLEIVSCTSMLKAVASNSGASIARISGHIDAERAGAGQWYSPDNDIDDPNNLLAGKILVSITTANVGVDDALIVNGGSKLIVDKLTALGFMAGS